MDWSIFTPKGCAHWMAGEFKLTPGMPRNPCDDPDVLEGIWRTSVSDVLTRVETGEAKLHIYRNRITDNLGNAKASYLLDVAWMTHVPHMILQAA